MGLDDEMRAPRPKELARASKDGSLGALHIDFDKIRQGYCSLGDQSIKRIGP
jgi:hypothetical protein